MASPEAADFASLLGTPAAGRPQPILCNRPGSYPWGVLVRRHPIIIDQVRAGHPYGPRQSAALDALLAEITDGTVQPLPSGAYAGESWAVWGAGYFGRPWLDLPFLWAEGYFFAKLLTAVDYWLPGPWQGVDPFAALKSAELHSAEFTADLANIDPPARAAEQPVPPGDRAGGPADLRVEVGRRLPELLLNSLWGNRSDLGFLINAEPGVATAQASHLVADQSPALLALLGSGRVRRLCVLADNSGRELLADLVLLDHLLRTGLVEQVEVQLKPHPYFISDATLADLLRTLRRLAAGPPGARSLAGRLASALRTGRLVPATHWFCGLSFGYDRMPADLRTHLAGFDLVLAKGDLNYRRLLGDCEWPAGVPFATAVAAFPTGLASLRTVKSDVVVGLAAGVAQELDRADPGWRTSGRYALVQALNLRSAEPAADR